MNFANLKDDVLDYNFLDGIFEPTTLREELELVGEDIEYCDYKVIEKDDCTKELISFTAWTENFVLYVNTEAQLVAVKRNP